MSNQAIRNQRVLAKCQAAYDSRQPDYYYEGPNEIIDEESEEEE